MRALEHRARRIWSLGQSRVARVLAAVSFSIAYALLGLVLVVTMLPRLTDFEVRRVVSGSMEPAVGLNSLAITRAVGPDDVQAGDIILFEAPSRGWSDAASTGHPILHRVIHVAEDGAGFHTRGDANEHDDGWVVPPANVRGELLFQIPYAGYLFLFMSSPLGYLLCVVLPGFAIMVPELLLIFRWIRYGEALQPVAEAQGAAS